MKNLPGFFRFLIVTIVATLGGLGLVRLDRALDHALSAYDLATIASVAFLVVLAVVNFIWGLLDE